MLVFFSKLAGWPRRAHIARGSQWVPTDLAALSFSSSAAAAAIVVVVIVVVAIINVRISYVYATIFYFSFPKLHVWLGPAEFEGGTYVGSGKLTTSSIRI